MSPSEILLDAKGHAISPIEISKIIIEFGESYKDTTNEIINYSEDLDDDGEVFIYCASRLLSNFGMTRSGPFQKNIMHKTLRSCWDAVGADLVGINNSVHNSGLSRDRYLLELNEREREGLIAEIW
jgi:hypothetical protein